MAELTHEQLAEKYGMTLDEVKALDWVHYKHKILRLAPEPLEVLVAAVHDPLKNLGLVVERAELDELHEEYWESIDEFDRLNEEDE